MQRKLWVGIQPQHSGDAVSECRPSCRSPVPHERSRETTICESCTAIGDEKAHQFTCLFSCQPRSVCCCAQVIYKGKTAESMPIVSPSSDMSSHLAKTLGSRAHHVISGSSPFSLCFGPILLLLDWRACAHEPGIPHSSAA